MRLDRVEKVDQGPWEQSKDSSEESRRRRRDAEHLCLAWDLTCTGQRQETQVHLTSDLVSNRL